jgi:glyoxylase-like metal-dependent hydrolase (beta-lactamase superfamily II)
MISAAPRAQVILGDTTVTYLPDGEARIVPTAAFPATTPDQWSGHLDDTGRLVVSIGAFLVRTPTTALLVDLGIGPVEFEVAGVGAYRGGALLESLAAEGLGAADIDEVVFTHLHHDHVGWATTGGDLTFAAARHRVHRDEWTHWANTESRVGPAKVWSTLAERIAFVDDGDDLAAHVRVVAAPGHTPGHLMVRITDPGVAEQVLVLGDVLHSPAQFAHPDWLFRSDHDTAAAAALREHLHTTNATTVLAGGHFAPAVFGRLRDRTWHALDTTAG